MTRPLRFPLLPLLGLALGVLTASCGKKAGDVATSTPASAITVASVDLGRSVGTDRHVIEETQSFRPNDVIYASVQTSGTAPNTTLQVKWTYQDGQVVDETSQTITTTGDEATEFHISKPGGWPAGKYKAEVYLNGQLVQTKEFEVKT